MHSQNWTLEEDLRRLRPTRIRHCKGLVVAAILTVLCPVQGRAQSHSAFPVDIVTGPAPQSVHVDGRTRLLYELHLTNLSASPVELLQLAVFGDDGNTPLARYRGEQLEKQLVAIGQADTAGKVRAIGGGRSVVIFLDLVLPGGAHPPAELRHRLSLSIPRKREGSGGTIENTVNGAVITLVQEPAPVLRPPLGGSAWIAFNSVGGDAHRRALNPFDGKARIAQRFAIDWMSLGPDGRLFHGDPRSNAALGGCCPRPR